jgi:hypothetical protein
MITAIRRARVPALTLAGSAGAYEVILGKHTLGTATRAGRRWWVTEAGYSRTLRDAAQGLLARRLSDGGAAR